MNAIRFRQVNAPAFLAISNVKGEVVLSYGLIKNYPDRLHFHSSQNVVNSSHLRPGPARCASSCELGWLKRRTLQVFRSYHCKERRFGLVVPVEQ